MECVKHGINEIFAKFPIFPQIIKCVLFPEMTKYHFTQLHGMNFTDYDYNWTLHLYNYAAWYCYLKYGLHKLMYSSRSYIDHFCIFTFTYCMFHLRLWRIFTWITLTLIWRILDCIAFMLNLFLSSIYVEDVCVNYVGMFNEITAEIKWDCKDYYE